MINIFSLLFQIFLVSKSIDKRSNLILRFRTQHLERTNVSEKWSSIRALDCIRKSHFTSKAELKRTELSVHSVIFCLETVREIVCELALTGAIALVSPDDHSNILLSLSLARYAKDLARVKHRSRPSLTSTAKGSLLADLVTHLSVYKNEWN